MNLELIETFLAVMKYQSVSAAAARLYVRQSTVSHRLAMLEDEVGVTLFNRARGGRTVELTSGGEAFVPIAQRWMAVFKDTVELKNQTVRQSLFVGGTELITEFTFAPLFQDLVNHNPEIQYCFKTYHSGGLYQLLESRSIDIAYVYSPRPFPDILTHKIYEEPMVFLCLKESSYQEPVSCKDLKIEDEVYLPWSAQYTAWHTEQWPKGKFLVQAGTGIQIAQYLTVPSRWAIVPISVYYALEKTGQFTYYPLAETPPNLCCYEITHRYSKPGIVSALENFRKAVDEFLEKSPDLLLIKDSNKT